MTVTGRRLAAGLAAVVGLLVFAAVALAVAPAPGTYKGKTGQKRNMQVKVDSTGRITFFKIRWLAPCDKKGKFWGPDVTQDVDGTTDRIKQPGDGSFSDKGSYDETDTNGFKGHFSVKLGGKFTTATEANGFFRVRIRVTRKGKLVDRCHKKVKWHVPA
jgi:hypothetical protein